MHVFALTGGIGSGKSTVARIFREEGLPVVDADALARQAVAAGEPALAALAREFGDDILRPDGELDRARLAEHVFNDEPARMRLNAIVHPEVRRLAQEAFSALESEGVPLVCYEVPLLFETGQQDYYRPVVVVRVTPETQLERTAGRDQAGREHAAARIASQFPLSYKAEQADYVIDNEGDLESTRQQAQKVLAALRAELIP